MKILELTSDIVFRSFMLSPNTINYKSRLLHLITKIPEEALKKAVYTSQELRASNKNNKIFRTDILVTVGNHIISIEMNNEYYDGLLIKNNNYVSKLSSEQLEKGEDYLKYKKIIAINIDNFHLYDGDKIVYEFMMKEIETGELEYDFYKSYHIDLKNVKDVRYNKNEINKMLNIFVTDDLNSLKGDKIMDEAIEALERLKLEEKYIGLYDKEKVERKIFNTRIKNATLEGKDEGIKEEKTNIARKMLESNMKVEDISKFTGLTKKEIEKLKNI